MAEHAKDRVSEDFDIDRRLIEQFPKCQLNSDNYLRKILTNRSIRQNLLFDLTEINMFQMFSIIMN